MTNQSPHQLEGRLNAQREALAVLLAWAMRQSESSIVATLEAGLAVQDHEEDPGVLPDVAFATEAAKANEMQLLLERANEIRRAP